MESEEFFDQLKRDEVIAAIKQAELRTSGEIRVFVSQNPVDDPVARAQDHFAALGMTNTRERNGILIFVAPVSQKFAVVGDEGVHSRCGQEFWTSVAAEMGQCFRKSDFTAGVVSAVSKVGELLAAHFPRSGDDKNELADDVAHD